METAKHITDKEIISRLKHGEVYIVPESDYGKAEIHRLNSVYILFSIPQFGGEPQFEKVFAKDRVDEIINEYNSWA